MKLEIMSDMHFRSNQTIVKHENADVLVCAGDAGNAYFAQPHRTVFVPGNHEYYGEDIDNYMAVEYHDGVKFVCATLWTNFMGRPNPLITRWINDFNYIKGADVETMQIFNKEAIEFLADEADYDCVIVTHFPPVTQCHNPNYPLDYVSDYFNNEIDHIKPKLWISGHTHWDHDFILGRTRYVSSQERRSKIIEI